MKISKPKDLLNKIKANGVVIVACLFFVFLIVVDTIHCREIEQLKEQVAAMQNKPVYVYDVQKIIANYTELNDLQQKYTQQLNELNTKVADAQKKLSAIKDKKAKAEYSEVYLSALTLKRDTLFEEYEKSVSELSARINNVLLALVAQLGSPVVYDVKSIAVTTPNVVDITPAVLETLQNKN